MIFSRDPLNTSTSRSVGLVAGLPRSMLISQFRCLKKSVPLASKKLIPRLLSSSRAPLLMCSASRMGTMSEDFLVRLRCPCRSHMTSLMSRGYASFLIENTRGQSPSGVPRHPVASGSQDSPLGLIWIAESVESVASSIASAKARINSSYFSKS
ncbi:hypothetical protein D3C73_1292700 [compost metagenome]